MTTSRRWIRRLCVAIAATLCSAAQSEPSYDDFVATAKPILDTRLRFESVEQDGVAQTAEAITLRGRLGFESGEVADTALLVEGEFIRITDEEMRAAVDQMTELALDTLTDDH